MWRSKRPGTVLEEVVGEYGDWKSNGGLGDDIAPKRTAKLPANIVHLEHAPRIQKAIVWGPRWPTLRL